MRFRLFTLLLLGLVACQAPSNQTDSQIPEESETPSSESVVSTYQLMVVLTDDWNQVQGTLMQFEGEPEDWHPVAEPIEIIVGKKGMGWGKGLPVIDSTDFANLGGPIKEEGDLKSPAGLFRLGKAFGYAAEADFVRLPYVPVSEITQCIEDVNSQYYNRIVSDSSIPRDWSSTDHMLRDDNLYEWGLEVQHNYQQPVPGGGSCIFLHVGRAGGKGTAGCTAMEIEKMRGLLEWLDPDREPLLVQMPREVYGALKAEQGWPEMGAVL